MAGAPFKMKGSPMQRNFNIGSPVKKSKESRHWDYLMQDKDHDKKRIWEEDIIKMKNKGKK